MKALFIIGALSWLPAWLYSGWTVLQTLSGRPVRRGDPMRLGVFVIATIFVLGSLRWVIMPDSRTALAGIFILLIAAGIYTLHLMRVYGRGEPV